MVLNIQNIHQVYDNLQINFVITEGEEGRIETSRSRPSRGLFLKQSKMIFSRSARFRLLPLFASLWSVQLLLPTTLCTLEKLSKLSETDLRPLSNGMEAIAKTDAKMNIDVSIAAMVCLCYLMKYKIETVSFNVEEGVKLEANLTRTSAGEEGSKSRKVVYRVFRDLMVRYWKLGSCRRVQGLGGSSLSEKKVKRKVKNFIKMLAGSCEEEGRRKLMRYAMKGLKKLNRAIEGRRVVRKRFMGGGKQERKLHIPLFVFDEVVYEVENIGLFAPKSVLSLRFKLKQDSPFHTLETLRQKPFHYQFHEMRNGDIDFLDEPKETVEIRCSIPLALLSAIEQIPFHDQTQNSLPRPHILFTFILFHGYSVGIDFLLIHEISSTVTDSSSSSSLSRSISTSSTLVASIPSSSSSSSSVVGSSPSSSPRSSPAVNSSPSSYSPRSSPAAEAETPITKRRSIKTVYYELLSAMVDRYRDFNSCNLPISHVSDFKDPLEKLNAGKSIVHKTWIMEGVLSPWVPCFPLTDAEISTKESTTCGTTYKISYSIKKTVE